MALTEVLERTAVPKVDFDTLVRTQRGIVTRAQLLAAGLDDGAIRHKLRTGHLHRVLPGLYATFSGELSLEQRRIAATVYVSECQITGLAALAWHGLRHLPDDHRIHVLVAHDRRRTSRGFVQVHRAKELDPSARDANGYRVCSIARATADACRQLDDLRSVRAVVAEVVQRGLVTMDALYRELDQAGSSRTRLLRIALGEVAGGVRSAPEAELRDMCRASAVLPPVLWNPRLVSESGEALPTPDGWIDDVGIAIEVDSREYHLGPEQWQATMRRHNQLSAAGALVMHFTPSEIRRRRHVVRLIEQAYQQRRAAGTRAAVRLASPTAR